MLDSAVCSRLGAIVGRRGYRSGPLWRARTRTAGSTRSVRRFFAGVACPACRHRQQAPVPALFVPLPRTSEDTLCPSLHHFMPLRVPQSQVSGHVLNVGAARNACSQLDGRARHNVIAELEHVVPPKGWASVRAELESGMFLADARRYGFAAAGSPLLSYLQGLFCDGVCSR